MFSCSQSIFNLVTGVDCDVAVGEVSVGGDVEEFEVGVVSSNLPLITWPCIIFQTYRRLLQMQI